MVELLCCGFPSRYILGFALLLTTKRHHLYAAAFRFDLPLSSLAYTLLFPFLSQFVWLALRFYLVLKG